MAVYGIDEKYVYVVDTVQQGDRNNPLQKSSRKNIELARFEKGPMAAKARTWTVSGSFDRRNLSKAIEKALRNNAHTYLNPAFKGLSYLGIQKLSKSIPTWLKVAKDPETDLELVGILMERAGTGGSLFRNFYRDFLLEAQEFLPKWQGPLREAHSLFSTAASHWRSISEILIQTSKSQNEAPLLEAARLASEIVRN
ncbi:MAG: DUF4872 domain-containing protein [Bdellovibrionota bacterium]